MSGLPPDDARGLPPDATSGLPPDNARGLPPDHLSNDPQSAFFDEAALTRGIGIKFNGTEKTNVEEYCRSEGWVRVALGKSLDRRGKPLTMKLKGRVEAYFKLPEA